MAPLRISYDLSYNVYQTNVVNSKYNGSLENDLASLKEAYRKLTSALEKAIIEDYTTGG